MQILTANQIHDWDQYTILNEPVSAIDLMERAASTCYDWLMVHGYQYKRFSIFCGKGNNGGDGLVIARLLSRSEHDVTVYILEFGHKGTEEFQANLGRLHETGAIIKFISGPETIQAIPAGDIVIDSLLGSGLNRPLEGLTAVVVQHINTSGNEIISIDIPSGLSADTSSKNNIAITAKHTLSFQCFKPAFLVSENENLIGQLSILDIGLHPEYLTTTEISTILVDSTLVKNIFRPRKKFSHKGTYGHALVIAGAYGKMGAAVLSTRACLRSGAGLCTIHIPICGYEIMQQSAPEAMVITDKNEKKNTALNGILSTYSSVGIGPGIGTDAETAGLLEQLFNEYQKPIVIDADALNLLAKNKQLLDKVPPYSILSPHPKEFERLFGETANDFERIELARQKAQQHQVVIVLKGHHTLIASPSSLNYFNTTGNAGMATGGTGDILTGILTGLLAQGYDPDHAAILGVYLHGRAGDHASKASSMEAMIASDITKYLGKAFAELV